MHTLYLTPFGLSSNRITDPMASMTYNALYIWANYPRETNNINLHYCIELNRTFCEGDILYSPEYGIKHTDTYFCPNDFNVLMNLPYKTKRFSRIYRHRLRKYCTFKPKKFKYKDIYAASPEDWQVFKCCLYMLFQHLTYLA